jgi:hypothetical protein
LVKGFTNLSSRFIILKVNSRPTGTGSEDMPVFVGEDALDRRLSTINAKKQFHSVGLISIRNQLFQKLTEELKPVLASTWPAG